MTLPELEETQAAWNKVAAGYDEFVTPTNLHLAAAALRRADLRPGMRLLDVAAGSGAVSLSAARFGANVTAVDISPVMIERLRARAHEEGLHLKAHVMDGHALEFNDHTFDMAASEFGVMLFPDLPRGLCEMVRVTRPGGRVVVVALGSPAKLEFFNFFIRAIQAAVPGFTGPPMDPPPLPFQLQDPEKLRREMTNAGLKDVRIEETSEELKYSSGKHFWDWVTNSNPVAGTILDQLNLTTAQLAVIQQAMDSLIRKRAAGSGTAYPCKQRLAIKFLHKPQAARMMASDSPVSFSGFSGTKTTTANGIVGVGLFSRSFVSLAKAGHGRRDANPVRDRARRPARRRSALAARLRGTAHARRAQARPGSAWSDVASNGARA